MDRARIHILNEKDKIVKDLEVMFNPTELSNSVSVKWEGEKGKMQFKGTDFASFTLNLFFDSYEEGVDVREDHKTRDGRNVIGTKRISELAIPSEEGKVGKNLLYACLAGENSFSRALSKKLTRILLCFFQMGFLSGQE